jgi:hypothetical protein
VGNLSGNPRRYPKSPLCPLWFSNTKFDSIRGSSTPGLDTNFARGRHSTGYRAFLPAGLSFQPADTDPRRSFPRPIPIFPCYICRSPVDFTGFQAGSGPARCLRYRPNLNFHRLGPDRAIASSWQALQHSSPQIITPGPPPGTLLPQPSDDEQGRSDGRDPGLPHVGVETSSDQS